MVVQRVSTRHTAQVTWQAAQSLTIQHTAAAHQLPDTPPHAERQLDHDMLNLLSLPTAAAQLLPAMLPLNQLKASPGCGSTTAGL
jgi:hypothetical protein